MLPNLFLEIQTRKDNLFRVVYPKADIAGFNQIFIIYCDFSFYFITNLKQ